MTIKAGESLELLFEKASAENALEVLKEVVRREAGFYGQWDSFRNS
ncbi:MAG: hypothetical protein ACUVTL_01870 [Thermoproteota archaeon]